METFDAVLFFKALGLAFVIEGVLWAGFPERMREAMRHLVSSPGSLLRGLGLVMLLLGLGICALAAWAG